MPTTREAASDMKEVVRRAQTGDREAFEQLYEAYKTRVFNLCLRVSHNRDLAEDLTQDTFLQVFRRIGSFRGEAAFSTWLHRVTFNVVLMALRRNQARLEEVPLETPAREDDSESRS